MIGRDVVDEAVLPAYGLVTAGLFEVV